MNTKTERYGSWLMLRCSGELTESSLEGFSEQMDRFFVEESCDLVLCMEDVEFVDSAGLEYLLDIRQQLKDRDQRLTLTNLTENMQKIMEITRLDAIFEILEDSAEMLKPSVG